MSQASTELTYLPVQYSLYGHIVQLAEAEKKGIEAAGGTVDVYSSDRNRLPCREQRDPLSNPNHMIR